MKALVIGYGSIGRRHADVLRSMGAFSEIAVLSRQAGLPFGTIRTLEEIPGLDPDYVVIASDTNLHYEQLRYLEEHLAGKTILVEKPLFDGMYPLVVRKNRVFVGYNLRFHPLLQLVKDKIAGRKLWNVLALCGSYLPEWRPGRDYRETSSAKKRTGGGVLLDLSHELDYVRWLIGEFNFGYAINEKASDLEIETDDLLLLSGRSIQGAAIQISLNYFTRPPVRRLLIDGADLSLQADLIANTMRLSEQGSLSEFAFPDLQRDDTYLAQHRAILAGEASSACTYAEALETMRLIDTIRSYTRQ